VEDGFEQAAALAPSRGELGLQPVAHRHQFVHFGDDAALLGEKKWDGLGNPFATAQLG